MTEIRDYAIILAIDSREEAEAVSLASSVGKLVDGVKIGATTLLSCGTQIVSKIRQKTDGPIIADLKVADIAFRDGGKGGGWAGTNSRVVEVAVKAGIDFVICHTIVGTSSIQECVAVAHDLGGKVLTLPYMTHEGAGLFFDQPLDVEFTTRWLEKQSPAAVGPLLALAKRKQSEAGWRSKALSISDLVLVLGELYGVDGYIAPGNRPEVMSDYRKITSRFALAPGVGRQGGRIEDVYRILGPKSAAAVGHAIADASDPAAACRKLILAREGAIR